MSTTDGVVDLGPEVAAGPGPVVEEDCPASVDDGRVGFGAIALGSDDSIVGVNREVELSV